jgi:hypothetical protein
MRKRAISLCLSVVLLLILIMSPISNTTSIVNAASDKTKIKTTINNYFKAAKKYDVKKMNKYVKDTKNYNPSELNDYSSLRSYLKIRNKSLTYSVQKIKVDKNKATVTVKCKYLDSSTTYESAFANLILFAFANADKNYSDKILLKKFNSIFKKSIKDSMNAYQKKYKTKTFKISLLKEKGNWKINTVTYDLANSVTANYYKAVKSMSFN